MEYLLAEQLAAMSANQLYTQLGAIHVANKHTILCAQDWAARL